ncbi:hypothetical protein SAMN05444414_10629 [Roseovarius marisflavi]|uniref:Uncharacterized protein n=1 Tax=Roseovarius marisflavi TaxID=1054996 RepID=A0A1M6Y8U1_9RHOB|nr:hypothetical protein SAMN05444414_10629 [Roseovarius marisflavi]
MKLHAYLSQSRHGIFYFRWPLPTHNHRATRKTLRLSLKTRCPQEAGMLGRHLASCGLALKQQLQEVRMDHATLRAAVIDYFHKQLADAKARRVSLGPYTPKEREQVLTTVGMLEEGNIEFWQLVGRDQAEQELARFFETAGLPRDEYWPHAMRVLEGWTEGWYCKEPQTLLTRRTRGDLHCTDRSGQQVLLQD